MKAKKLRGGTGPSERFREIFRAEHRQIRDVLLDLINAFQLRDKSRVSVLLGDVAQFAGPHFRYEEEALYPALVEFFGKEYIEELFRAHDRVIGTAQELIAISGKDELSESDVTSAVRGVRSLLPYVSDCDGVSIMVEKLSPRRIGAILERRDAAQLAAVDLLTWAAQVRQQPDAQLA